MRRSILASALLLLSCEHSVGKVGSVPEELAPLVLPALKELTEDSYLVLAFGSEVLVAGEGAGYCNEAYWARRYLVALGQNELLAEVYERAQTQEAKVEALRGLLELGEVSQNGFEQALRNLSVQVAVQRVCDCLRSYETVDGSELLRLR